LDKNPQWAERLPFLTSDLLQQRILWSIRLRWLSLFGFFVSTLVIKFSFGLPIPFNSVWTVLETLAIINIVYYLIFKIFKNTSFVTEMTVLIVHAVVDFFFLTVIVHLTGGIENPIYLFYVFHVVISSIIFPKWIPVMLATFSVIMFGSLVYFEYTGILYHYSIFGTDLHANKFAVFIILSIFTITIYVSNYICMTFMVIYRNIKRTIDKQNQQLIDADKQKTQFYQYTSHELKSPIIAIKTTIDSVVKNFDTSLDEKAVNLLSRASLRCAQMLDIIKELLILTRNRSQSGLLEAEEIYINKIINDIIRSEETNFQEKNLVVQLNLDSSDPVLSGKVNDFEKVFSNLIGNAIRYNKRNGKVSVISSRQDRMVTIRIEDTGIGIPEKDLSNIFAEFYRSENARKVINFGTGLGLSLVKQIVENYHGTIAVQSKIDVGTVFIINLPLGPVGGRND